MMGLWTYGKMKRKRKRILVPLQCVDTVTKNTKSINEEGVLSKTSVM